MIIHHYSEVIDLSELNGDETETLINMLVENLLYYATRDIEGEFDTNRDTLDEVLQYVCYK